MIRTVDFVMDFDPANPPKRMKTGGVRTTPVAASKALEMRGVKTEAIKDLETPPPVSVADNNPILVPPPQLERLPFDPRFDDATPMNPMEYGIKQEPDPSNIERMKELSMILQAVNNMGGIMSTPTQPKTGLAALSEITYGDGGTIKV